MVCFGEIAMNSPAVKLLTVVLLLGIVIGLAWICHPSSEYPISVSLITPLKGINGEKAQIVLKAGMNGHGISHGKVKLDFTLIKGGNPVSSPSTHGCIEGFTDAHGVFISNWTPGMSGEYMLTASVSKSGYTDGQSVCFLRVANH